MVKAYNGIQGRASDQVINTAQASSELASAAATHESTVQDSSRSDKEKEEAHLNADQCIQKGTADVQKARDLRDRPEISLPTVTEDTVDLNNAIAP